MTGSSDSQQSGSDRRAEERISARIEVRFDEPSQAARALRAYSLNLSAGGLCLKTQRTYQVGDSFRLSLAVGGEDFSLEAVVAWVRGGAAGVRFVRVTDQDRERLERITATLPRGGA